MIEEVYQQEWARVVATLARSYGLDLAEEAAAEAFASALDHWEDEGIPDRPGAWITTVARRKALDRIRREATREQREAAAQELAAMGTNGDAPVGDDSGPVVDDRLRLVFTCCHPALDLDAQIALSLRLLCGLTTEEIARAFLVKAKTMAQRLVRAKHKIAAAGIPYRVPDQADLPARTAGVLRVVYLVFREGYAPTADDVVRPDLCDEALRLGRLLSELLPDDGEVLGLLALMLLQDSRRVARVDADGDLVLLADQDRSRWNTEAIVEGLDLVATALARSRGPYALQAAIAAHHAAARSADTTDWARIVRLYDELARVEPGPAVALNRAVAVAEVDGPGAGLAILDALASTSEGDRLAQASHHFHGARARFLEHLGHTAQARAAYDEALQRARTSAERRYYERRRAAL